MKRKSAAILLLLCMIFCLIGCVSQSDSAETPSFSYITSSKSESSDEESKTSTTESSAKTEEKEDSSKPENDDDSDKTSQETSSKSTTVTVPEKEETSNDLVWIPVNGGKKYHRKESCSNMKNPKQVTKETATESGFGPCGKCY